MKKILVLPDIHCPNHEERAIKPILSFIKFYNPDYLIQLGDFCDWDSVSSYGVNSRDEVQLIQHEINSSNALLSRIDNALRPKTKKIMLAGNHEARYEKFVSNDSYTLQSRRLKQFSTWHEEYNLKMRNWAYLNYGNNFQIGKLVFTHGWYCGNSAAKRMAECFPGRNVIFGHTHQHLIYGCMNEDGNPIESESIGTLSRFDLSYLNGKPPVNWIHSFMYIDMENSGNRFTKHFVRIIDGTFIEHGVKFS